MTDSLEGVSEYTYDERGQLLKETRDNVVINEMVYSVGGNIKYKNGKTYSYDGDRLISYNGKLLSYDAQGNPTLYRGHSLEWEKGRQLKSFDSNSYSYNANGIRTSKTVGGVKHKYILDGAKILKETYGDNTIIPLYDSENSVCGINYNGTSYFFYKNLQGDIIALANANGVIAARYTYDAWGKCTVKDAHGNTNTSADFIGNINPFRYRGYYYDSETKLYYLQSRYYDAEIGRFVNGDEILFGIIPSGTIGHNVYSYCVNDPCNLDDITGHIAIFDDLAIVAFIGLCAMLMVLVAWMGTTDFVQSWIAFCQSISNGMSSLGTAIVSGGTAARGWTKKKVKIATKEIKKFITIVKTEKKVVEKVKTSRKKWNNFFEIWFDDIGIPILGKPINRKQAVSRARLGLNSITYFSSDALYVANYAGGSKAMHHQRHGGASYFNHYHINNHKNSAHIFYIISG